MAICSASSRCLALILLTTLSFSGCFAEIHTSEIRSDGQPIIPLDVFGFTHTGRLELNVSQISFSNSNPDLDLSKIGFFLCTRDSWLHVLQQLEESDITCALKSDVVKTVYSFDRLKGATSFDKNGRRDYLSAGKAVLPRVYFLFSLIYFGMAAIWIRVLHKKRLTVFRIHFFMLAVVILKALNLLCEAEDKSYIKRTGSAHGWDVLFYIFSFLKGISLFTLIVLIGTGWSFLKPYLQDKEKTVLMIVIPLQVVANIAQIVIDESGPYGHDWFTWKQVFLLVDILCCCAVLFPIVWSIKNLREAARTDGKAATITSYRYLWTSTVAGELATLAFYVYTGYKFKPEAHNPYFVIDDDEEEAAAEQLKLEDEFEL
ncbi:unnamed protein product, partial [Vitis vinifera]